SQAADGIRAFHVTGVQTCALPIFAGLAPACPVVLTLDDPTSAPADAVLRVTIDTTGTALQVRTGYRPDRVDAHTATTTGRRLGQIGRASCRGRGATAGLAGQ